MLDRDPQPHDRAQPQPQPGDAARAPGGGGGNATATRHAVAQCGGDPGKLARLFRGAPTAQRQALIAEAHQLFGNAVVQQALAEPAAADAHAPVAREAMMLDTGAAPGISYSNTEQQQFDRGDVHVEQSVTCTVRHGGDSPIFFNLPNGILTIGNEQIAMNLKSVAASEGRGLDTSGGEVTVVCNRASKTSAKVEDGYVGLELDTDYTIKGRGGWTANISMASFAGTKPPKPHHHWYDDVPGVDLVAAGIAALAGIAAAVVASSPEWGPIVVACAA